MRAPALVLVGFLVALDAGAQGQTVSQPGAALKQAGQVTEFRQPGIRPAAGEGAIHTAAAAARKRAPSSPVPARQGSSALADRLAMQLDLAWTGDYTGLINGEPNEKTTAAIKAFQKNRKFKESGVLNTQERALLAAAAKAKQAQVGWTMVDDAVTGARLGIPMKQVPNKSRNKAGTPLVLRARSGPGRDLQDQRTWHHARSGLRAAEKTTIHPQARDQCASRRFLSPFRNAGLEEVLCARRLQGWRSAGNDGAL